MVRVKLIKYPVKNPDPKDPLKVGGVYEAFETKWGKEQRYALNVNNEFMYFAPKEECEIIEEEPTTEVIADGKVQNILNGKPRILMVEDGSVDVDDLEEWCEQNNIKLIVYRNGANKPEWLN